MASGNKLYRPADEGVARLPRPADDAVHAGDRHGRSHGRSTRTGSTSTRRAARTTSPPRTPGRSITLKRNPHYKGGRAANVDTIQVNVGNDVAVQYQNVERGTSDYASTGIPPTEWRTVVQKYGLNRKDGRVQVRSLLDVRYVAMNHGRPLFRDNPGLAKAVNWAVDRQAFSAQGGYLYGKRTGQILPPGIVGYKPQGIYPLRVTANTIKQAKKLAEGNLAAATRCSGRRTRGRHRSRRS